MPIYRMTETQPFLTLPADEPFAVSEFSGGITYLYYLYDPSETHARVHYVGITGDPKKRFQQHLSVAQKRSNLRELWLYTVLAKGVEPIMEVRKMYEHRAEAQQAEQKWIGYLRSKGYWLCNGRMSD